MAKYKNKLIAAGIILVILAAAWIWGGGYARRDETPAADIIAQTTSENPTNSPSLEQMAESSLAPNQESTAAPNSTIEPAVISTPDATPSKSASMETSVQKEGSSEGVYEGNENYSKEHGMQINPETGKDKYLTDPVPDGKPLPVEPQNVNVGAAAYTCTLSVRCDTILNNMKYLDKEKVELVPSDGILFKTATITFYEGESVFNVLQREMKRAKIHMSFRNTPIYNSAYIEAINNLYEFDCGELSGWMYKVNGWFPNYGCSRYQLKQGDVIEWVYTCDLGRDVGGYYATGE